MLKIHCNEVSQDVVNGIVDTIRNTYGDNIPSELSINIESANVDELIESLSQKMKEADNEVTITTPNVIPENQNMVAINSGIINATNYTPAVVFDGYDVYTRDGYTQIPARSYNALFTVNDKVLNTTIKDMENGIGNHKINTDTIANIIISHVQSAADNLLICLSNIYCVFIANINDLLCYEENGQLKSDYHVNTHFNFENSSFDNMINEFLSSTTAGREVIINESIPTFIISFVNRIGMDIYNDTRTQLAQYLGTVTADENDILNFFTNVDHMFARLMGDMTYEAGLFIQNIKSISPYLLASDTMPKIHMP